MEERLRKVVWLDALLTNVDRTIKNNQYVDMAQRTMADRSWGVLYFHHSWTNWQKNRHWFLLYKIKDHVLLPFADKLEEVDINSDRY